MSMHEASLSIGIRWEVGCFASKVKSSMFISLQFCREG
jgi:hypothetical protein